MDFKPLAKVFLFFLVIIALFALYELLTGQL